MGHESIYDEYDQDDYDSDEEAVSYHSPHTSVQQYRNERYAW